MVKSPNLRAVSAATALPFMLFTGLKASPIALNGPWLTGSASATAGTPSFSPNNTSSSFTWGSGTAAGGSSAMRGLLWTYFDGISLTNDGDWIRVSFTAQWSAAATASAGSFRFGLFDHNGKTRSSNLADANTDAAFDQSLGYFTTVNLGGSTILHARTGGDPNVLSTVTTSPQQAFHTDANNTNALAAGTPYDFSLKITRSSATVYAFQVVAASAGIPNTTTTLITAGTFNTLYLLNTQQTNLNSITFGNFELTSGNTPPPPPPPPPQPPMDALGPPLLGIDFNRSDALASPSQSFFRAIGGSATQAENASTYTKSFGPRQVTVSQPDGVNFEFRGGNDDSTRAIPGGDTSLSFLAADFIATRRGAIQLSITGLEAGDYLFRSWHLDSLTTGPLGFAQGAAATTPNTIEARIGGNLKAAAQGTSLGSSGLGTTFIDNEQIPRIEFGFSHDGSSPLVIELRSLIPNGADNFLLLNGFAIHSAPVSAP